MSERVDALQEVERELTAMRRRAMKVGRIVREQDLPNVLYQTMLLVDNIEGVKARILDLQSVDQMRHDAEDRLRAVPTPWRKR